MKHCCKGVGRFKTPTAYKDSSLRQYTERDKREGETKAACWNRNSMEACSAVRRWLFVSVHKSSSRG